MDASNFFGLYNIMLATHTMPENGGILAQDSYFVHLVHWTQKMEDIRRELDQHNTEAQQQSMGRR